MRAAVFSEFGGPEVLRVTDVANPEPGPGEVLVRVGASALNHLDVWVRRGLPIETTMPHIGGSDVAGTVESLGPDVTGVTPGTRVVVDPSLSCGECEWCLCGEEPLCERYRILGEHTQGGFAELVVVPARNLFAIPASYSFERAAAVPLAFLTAWRALMGRAQLRKGESVLITGASGGVSTAAIQIARHAGARVHAVTSARWMSRVRELGADYVYDRTDGDWTRSLAADTGKRGVDVILDSVGAQMWQQNLRSLARGGRIVVYGGTSGPKVEIDVRALFWKQTSIMGTTMASRTEFEAAMRHVFAGDFEPVVDDVMRLDDIRTAHEKLEAGDVFGKLVIVP